MGYLVKENRKVLSESSKKRKSRNRRHRKKINKEIVVRKSLKKDEDK